MNPYYSCYYDFTNSFPVFRTELQEVKLQYSDDDGNLRAFDGFARLCTLPALARLPQHYENAFFIKVSHESAYSFNILAQDLSQNVIT